jgi:uncharacterized LabA/DUF88 family protein
MAQRVALLIDGTNVGKGAAQRGVELDYSLLASHVMKKREGSLEREIVIANVYVGPAANPTDGRERFFNYVRSLGYQVRVCQEEGSSLKSSTDLEILLDMLVLAFTGRVDVIVLVSGDAGFLKGIRTAQAYGVCVEVMGFADAAADALKERLTFVDLEEIGLLRATGGWGGGKS